MSGYSDTSRAAFARVDATAGQRRVLAVFRNGMTRQDIADTGIPINVVCPRIRELLDAKTLKELPAKDGKHPLELVTIAAGRAKQALGNEPDRPAGISAESLSRPDVPSPAAPEHAPRSPHCDGNLTVLPAREIASHGARSVYVVPAGGYPWWQISRQTAQAIYDDGKRNGLYEFAEKRLALKS